MFLRREMRRVLVQESVVFFPQIALCTQRILPLPLQAASHQAILGLDGLILPFGTLRPHRSPAPAVAPNGGAGVAFLLNVLDRLQAQFQGRRLQGPEDLLVTRSSTAAGREPATIGALELPAHAPIIGGRTCSDSTLHAPATRPANQAGPSAAPRRREAPRGTGPGAVLEQPLLVGQVTLPRDIGRQAVPLEHLPFRHRHLAHLDLAATGGRPFVIDTATPIGSKPPHRSDDGASGPACSRGPAPFQLAASRTLVDAHTQADLVPRQIAVEPPKEPSSSNLSKTNWTVDRTCSSGSRTTSPVGSLTYPQGTSRINSPRSAL